MRQKSPNSADFSFMKNLDVYANQIAVSRNEDGRLELFFCGAFSKGLYQVQQKAGEICGLFD